MYTESLYSHLGRIYLSPCILFRFHPYFVYLTHAWLNKFGCFNKKIEKKNLVLNFY